MLVVQGEEHKEEGSALAHGGGYGSTGPVWVALVLVVRGEGYWRRKEVYLHTVEDMVVLVRSG